MNWYKNIKIASLRPYGASEFLRKLKKLNVQYIRNANGDHEIWGFPGTNFRASIPRGSNLKTIGKGTIKHILRDLGISQNDFENGKITSHPLIDNLRIDKKKQEPEMEEQQIEETETSWKKQPWFQEAEKYELV
jgi:hypothetical protein